MVVNLWETFETLVILGAKLSHDRYNVKAALWVYLRIHTFTVTDLHKLHQTHIHIVKPLDITQRVDYTGHSYFTTRTSMSKVYAKAQKQRFRITLELDVLEDFNPRDINWERLFELEPAEKVSAYIEDLNRDPVWWVCITNSCASWESVTSPLVLGGRALYLGHVETSNQPNAQDRIPDEPSHHPWGWLEAGQYRSF